MADKKCKAFFCFAFERLTKTKILLLFLSVFQNRVIYQTFYPKNPFLLRHQVDIYYTSWYFLYRRGQQVAEPYELLCDLSEQ
jgi:hypothetical protein